MKSILPFLQNLKANNNRDWFIAHKKDFDQANKELSEFITQLLAILSREEPALSELKAKDCLFRIYRDVRFSKNKEPYKTNMGAVIAPGGRKSNQACYYVHIDPDGSFLAGGIYMPEPDALKRIRQEIDYNYDEFTAILESKDFKSTFTSLDDNGRLKTNPKGYEGDNPAIAYLKNKSFTVSCPLDAKQVTQANLLDYCEQTFRILRPLNAFLNRSISLTD